jgi:hypothetical protein
VPFNRKTPDNPAPPADCAVWRVAVFVRSARNAMTTSTITTATIDKILRTGFCAGGSGRFSGGKLADSGGAGASFVTSAGDECMADTHAAARANVHTGVCSTSLSHQRLRFQTDLQITTKAVLLRIASLLRSQPTASLAPDF